jgi:hypothetical protein
MSEDEKTTECIDLEKLHEEDYINQYEIRAYLSLDEYDIRDSFSKKENEPLPYIVTIDKLSKKVLSIKRNWVEDDETQTRRNDFIHYYGLGGDVNE